MNTLPPTRKGAEKTWVNAGLSASGIELTNGAKGGLVAFNFRDRQTLIPARNRWRLERQREIPEHLPVVRVPAEKRAIGCAVRKTPRGRFTTDAGCAGYVWGSPSGEPDFTFGDVSNLLLDAKPEKPRPTPWGLLDVTDGAHFKTYMDIQTAQQWIIAIGGLVIVTAALACVAVTIAKRQAEAYRKSAEYWRGVARGQHD